MKFIILLTIYSMYSVYSISAAPKNNKNDYNNNVICTNDVYISVSTNLSETIKNKIVKNKIVKNKTVKNKIVKNKTVKNKIVKNKTVKNKTVKNGIIPIMSGKSGTITYFTDTVFQCITGQSTGNALAINPLLLGFTITDWTNLYQNADRNKIPWCGRSLTIKANGESFTGTIIDTCDPTGNQFKDPNTGRLIGGKCDYTNTIDLFGQPGLDFLNVITNGDDFYDGELTWELN